jgi:hypothetical protein
MDFVPVQEPPSELDTLLNPDNPVFGFATKQWVEVPTYLTPASEETDLFYRLLANADAFKQHGSPIAWY